MALEEDGLANHETEIARFGSGSSGRRASLAGRVHERVGEGVCAPGHGGYGGQHWGGWQEGGEEDC